VLIGVISWLFGTLIAFPLSRFLSFQVGNLFTGAPLIYTFSTFGVLLWLLIVVVLSAIASFLPAWNAARRPVREVLMYDG
jgi:putative ABC transport system permease protein